MSHRPNFFLIGAPKCGTTALASYLAEHPQVLMSVPKEPHYFATDLPGIRWTTDLRHYQSLFEAADRIVCRYGDASVWYLYSREAIAHIRDYNPDARLIVLLRNPADMVYSLHGQFLYNPIENIPNFRKAWESSQSRKKGQNIPALCSAQELLYYDEVARYGEQLERVYHYFPREQVRVFLYEDFAVNPAAVYSEVLQFLDLDIYDREDFPVINSRKAVRSQRTQYALRRTLDAMHRFRMGVQYRMGIDLSRLYIHGPVMKALVRWNLKQPTRVPLSPEIRRIIQNNYRDDGMKLASLIGRDLSRWYNPT